ncbi:MAG: AAA family ATPase [Clostridiales Family XIII bacterium]|nr:AAA family ATPase [Clostridiales Family XIII bacterium]
MGELARGAAPAASPPGPLIKELKGMGFSYSASVRLFEAYGEDAPAVVRKEPYRIAIEVPGIGFKTADAVAAALSQGEVSGGGLLAGLADGQEVGLRERENGLFSAQRTAAGILYILTRYATEGHTCIPRQKLRDRAVELLDVTSDDIDDALVSLALDGRAMEASVGGAPYVFLSSYLIAERHICSDLMRLMNAEPRHLYADADDLIRATEASLGIELSPGQRGAVKQSIAGGVFVITGGPGTGKTTIIKAVIDIFEHAGFKTAVAAPTGRAAKRVAEATGHRASTIHRLLEYYYDEAAHRMYFGRNADNRLDCEAVIIDEASMVDALLMEALLAAMKTGARLVIVGDVDQLPPVGAGDVLRDIIASERVGAAVLTEIYRQAAESMITVGAHRINRGEYPFAEGGMEAAGGGVGNDSGNNADSGACNDLFMMERGAGVDALSEVIKLCTGHLPPFASGLPTDGRDGSPSRGPVGIQVLTPMKKGLLGSINLNKELQEVLNPPREGLAERKYGERVFRVGDRVMQTRNNYSLDWSDSSDGSEGRGIFNGDMGVITDIDRRSGAVTVAFDDTKHVSLGSEGLLDIEHAYAITVHKSQGSEFPAVVIPVYNAAPMLMTRNLIYTAVTRGKALVALVGSPDSLRRMIANDKSLARYSALRSFLAEYSELGDAGAEAVFGTDLIGVGDDEF